MIAFGSYKNPSVSFKHFDDFNNLIRFHVLVNLWTKVIKIILFYKQNTRKVFVLILFKKLTIKETSSTGTNDIWDWYCCTH